MGQTGTDIVLIGEAKSKFPFSVECKNQETFHLTQWIEQAKANEATGTDWLLVIAKNRFSPVVVLDAEAFFKIYEKVIK